MGLIKTPENYIAEENAIQKAGEVVKVYGKHALIIGSETALSKVETDLTTSLEKADIAYNVEKFIGYPTLEKAQRYADQAAASGADVLIAVGGGKAMDVTKAAGSLSGRPVVTIPTIAATCAAWAAVSVIYTEEGDFEQFFNNRFTPRAILVDYTVIAQAPERYLKAGIVDTYAKLYELAPGVKGKEDSIELQISFFGSKLAFDILDQYTPEALLAVRNGEVNEALKQVIDSIVYLAGFVGSFVGAKVYSGYAHPFYHSSRRIASSRKALHGELVAYGILAQIVMEKRAADFIEETIRRFAAIDEAFLAQDLGLIDKEDKRVIAQRTIDEFGSFQGYGIGQSVDEILNAFDEVDRLVAEKRG